MMKSNMLWSNFHGSRIRQEDGSALECGAGAKLRIQGANGERYLMTSQTSDGSYLPFKEMVIRGLVICIP